MVFCFCKKKARELPTSARSAYWIATVVGCRRQRTTGSSNLLNSSKQESRSARDGFLVCSVCCCENCRPPREARIGSQRLLVAAGNGQPAVRICRAAPNKKAVPQGTAFLFVRSAAVRTADRHRSQIVLRNDKGSARAIFRVETAFPPKAPFRSPRGCLTEAWC